MTKDNSQLQRQLPAQDEAIDLGLVIPNDVYDLALPNEIVDPKLAAMVNDLNSAIEVRSQEADLLAQQTQNRRFGFGLSTGSLLLVSSLVTLPLLGPILPVLGAAGLGASLLGLSFWDKRSAKNRILEGKELSQQQASDRFENLKVAVKGMVSKDVEKPTVSALNDAYAIARALERYPDLQTFSPEHMRDMIGQTLLAGNLLLQLQDYKQTRWGQAKSVVRPDLIKQQQELQAELDKESTLLYETVAESTLQLSLIRGEILRMESQALLAQDFTGSLLDMLHRVQSLREALASVNLDAAKALKQAQGA